jgi:hypothetical protein
MSNPYNVSLNFNNFNWNLFQDQEQMLSGHESQDVDLESTLDAISEANELAKQIRELY